MLKTASRVARTSVAVLLAAVAAGCYESAFPLDPEPRVELDGRLLGTWRCLPLDQDADEQPVTLTVTQTRDRVLGVVWQEPGKGPDRYEAYASTVGGGPLLNVRELTDGTPSGQWVFARYELARPNVLQLQIVAQEAMAGVAKTPVAVRQALEPRRLDPALYSDFCVCARAKAPQ